MSELRRLDWDEAKYHSDPCEQPSLSYSVAKTLLDQSPLHAWHHHPRFGGAPHEESKTFDRGTLIHKLLLGRGKDIAVVNANDWRSKAAKEARDNAYAAGQVPVKTLDYANAMSAADTIRLRLGDLGIDLCGESEVPIVWRERGLEGDIWARGMLDHVVVYNGRATILDVKTTENAHPKVCLRSILTYSYELQRAAYVRGLGQWMPELDGRIDFVFLFVEPRAPYAVTPARLDGILRERGARRWRAAVDLWARCLPLEGEWPGYTEGSVELIAPNWLLNEEWGGDDGDAT